MKWTSFDPGIFLPVLFLILASLGMLKSLNDQIFISQLIFVGLSVVLFSVVQLLDVDVLAERSTQIYIASIIGLIFLAILGIAARGAVRWFTLFGFNIQISEIMKPFFVLFLAHFLTGKEKNLQTLLLALLVTFPAVFLILRQPDLGTALVYVFTLLLGLIATGFPLKYFGIGLGGITIISPLLWHFLHDYQRARLESFLHLSSDPLGSSYNSIQSVIAVGSGQLWGRGIGLGSQSMLRFLPERHTDFIFAALTEATGFLGALCIMGALGIFLWRLISLATQTRSEFDQLFFCFTFAFFFVQAVMNIGMNMGLLPIVGITLPFVSYGGSSLLTSSIFLGFVYKIMHSRKTKQMVEIR